MKDVCCAHQTEIYSWSGIIQWYTCQHYDINILVSWDAVIQQVWIIHGLPLQNNTRIHILCGKEHRHHSYPQGLPVKDMARPQPATGEALYWCWDLKQTSALVRRTGIHVWANDENEEALTFWQIKMPVSQEQSSKDSHSSAQMIKRANLVKSYTCY